MSEPRTSWLMLMTTGLFLAMAAARWHEAAAAAPDRVDGTEGATVVLLVQPGDCPQRRATMMRWLAAFQDHPSAGEEISVSVAVLAEGPGAPDDRLAPLPRLDDADTRSIARAVLRAGIPGTPALALVGRDGTVLLADTFAPEGLGPRFLHAAALLPDITGALAPSPSTEPAGR